MSNSSAIADHKDVCGTHPGYIANAGNATITPRLSDFIIHYSLFTIQKSNHTYCMIQILIVSIVLFKNPAEIHLKDVIYFIIHYSLFKNRITHIV